MLSELVSGINQSRTFISNPMLARLLSDLGSEQDFDLDSDGSETFIWLKVKARLLSGVRCEQDFYVASNQSWTFWNPRVAELLFGIKSESDFYLEANASWAFICFSARAGLLSGIRCQLDFCVA